MKKTIHFIFLALILTLTSCGQKHNVSKFIESEVKDSREKNVHTTAIQIYEPGLDDDPLTDESIIEYAKNYASYKRTARVRDNQFTEYAAGTTSSARNHPFRQQMTISAGEERNKFENFADYERTSLEEHIPSITKHDNPCIWVFHGYSYSYGGRSGYTGGTLYLMDKSGKNMLKKYSLLNDENIVSLVYSIKNYNNYKWSKIDVE